MTPEAHNRYVGLAHLGYGVSNILVMGLVITFFLRRWQFWDREDLTFSSLGFGMVGLLTLVYTLPSFVAAWALLRRKPWAKMAAIIAGVVAAMYFPVGPAVTVYTFWFLFNATGKALYDRPKPALSSATAVNWDSQPDTERARPGFPDWH